MKLKKRLSRTLCVSLAALTVLSVAAVATGVGSMEDPLVTLSYLNEKFLPDVMAKVEEKLSGRREELSAALDAMGEITGETMNELVIDEVFARFCVGK